MIYPILFFKVQRDVPSELESTRIKYDAEEKIVKGLDQSQQTPLTSLAKTDSKEKVNEIIGNQSSRILRSCRKGKLILNFYKRLTLSLLRFLELRYFFNGFANKKILYNSILTFQPALSLYYKILTKILQHKATLF